MSVFSEERYGQMIEKLFMRFPSFQKAGASAYKPGIANMEFIDSLMGHPHRNYRIVHVAGTNGKGSCTEMMSNILIKSGYKVGKFLSPHLIKYNERISVNGTQISDDEMSEIIDLVLTHQQGREFHTHETFNARAKLMLHNSDVFRHWANR